tara:strand:- start:225 stop:704 length:480 start_codon:yes stop_codon:yes gene_type:complete
MKTDRIFVLMLVILLPMSGCFDNSVGDAEGQVEPGDSNSGQSPQSETTTVIPTVMTVHIEEGQTHTVTLNGTTLQLMDVYSQNDGYWASTGGGLRISMNCESGFSMTTVINYNIAYDNPYLPILPNTECELILNSPLPNSTNMESEKILIFSEVELDTL